MSVKLGIAPIAWSNDDMPELGGETSLEQCLEEASLAGFIGIESGGKFPKTSKELLPKLNDYNLNLCSGWYGGNLRKNSTDEEKQLIRNQLDLFKDCNAPCIVFAEVSGSIQGDPNRKLSTRPQMDSEEWSSFCKKISEMAKFLEGEGMPLAYHHHMGTVIETQEDTIRLLENTDESVKLTLDTGHMLFAQGNSKKILEDFSSRIIHIHCKDIRKDVLDNSLKKDLSFRGAFLEGAFTVPGDGCIDYKPLFDILKTKNYSGWLVVEAEQDPAKANPFEYAKIGYKYLTETLKNSDVEIFKKN
jgi:inosose dehydratase